MNLNTYKIETFIEKMKTMTVPEMAEEKETNVNSFWSYISKYKVYEHPLFLEYFKEKGVDRGTKHRAYLRIIRHIEAKPKKFRHVTFKGILPGKTSEAKGNIAVKNNNIQIVFTCNYCGTEKIKHCVSDVLRATGEKKCTGCAELLANKGERYCSGCNETHPLDAFNEGTWACRASVAKKREEAPEEYNIYRKYQAVKLRAKKQNIPCNFTLEGLGITVTQEKRRNGSPRYKASGYPKVCPVLGIKLVWNTGNKDYVHTSAHFDKIDPALGYIEDNVQIVSGAYNVSKGDLTPEQRQKVAEYWIQGKA